MEELSRGEDHGRIIQRGRPWKNYSKGKTMEELSGAEDHGRIIQMERPWKNYPDGKTMEELSRWEDYKRIIQRGSPGRIIQGMSEMAKDIVGAGWKTDDGQIQMEKLRPVLEGLSTR